MALDVTVVNVCYGVGSGLQRLHRAEAPLRVAHHSAAASTQLSGCRGAGVTPYMVMRPQEGQHGRTEAAGTSDTMKASSRSLPQTY